MIEGKRTAKGLGVSTTAGINRTIALVSTSRERRPRIRRKCQALHRLKDLQDSKAQIADTTSFSSWCFALDNIGYAQHDSKI